MYFLIKELSYLLESSSSRLLSRVLQQSHPHTPSTKMWAAATTVHTDVKNSMATEMGGSDSNSDSGSDKSVYSACGFNKLEISSVDPESIRIGGLYAMLNTPVTTYGSSDSAYLSASCLAILYAVSVQLNRCNYVYLTTKPKSLNYYAHQEIQTGILYYT